jgi:hypothetical protein
MHTSKLSRLGTAVTELTKQPEFEVITRRARRRRIKRLTANTAGVIVVVLNLAGIMFLQVLPGSVATPTGAPRGPLAWAAASDANHLYAELHPCTGCEVRFVGSDDGGKHWDVRQAVDTAGMLVRGPTTLVAPATGPTFGNQPMRVSVDGGRGWKSVATDNTPQAKVPTGGWLDCNSTFGLTSIQLSPLTSCLLRAVDPVAGTSRPLAPPPGVTPAMVAPVPAAAGLWVLGVDNDKNAAMSVSRDGGVTWYTHHFGAPTNPSPGVDPSATAPPDPSRNQHTVDSIQISTFDGQTVNAVLTKAPYAYGFRSTDGGQTWQPTNGGGPLPTIAYNNPAVTLPDGTHVLQDLRGAHPTAWFGKQPDARSYSKANVQGWPSLGAMMGGDGHLVGYDTNQIWLSTNGINWQRITPG